MSDRDISVLEGTLSYSILILFATAFRHFFFVFHSVFISSFARSLFLFVFWNVGIRVFFFVLIVVLVEKEAEIVVLSLPDMLQDASSSSIVR